MYYEDSLDPGPADGQSAAIPEKFRDPATGQLRADALLRAYVDLERRMGGMVRVPGETSSTDELAGFRRAIGVPDTPEDYCIECRHEMLTPHPEVNRRLHEAGFTPRQAQLVYDLALDHVIPTIEGMRGEYETRRGLDRLKDYFGGDSRWSDAARQVSTWGKANLPPDVYGALSGSPEGVIAMQKMMGSGEPMMGKGQGNVETPLSEAELKKMMADPRYWKQRDPTWIGKVQDGFAKLYGE